MRRKCFVRWGVVFVGLFLLGLSVLFISSFVNVEVGLGDQTFTVFSQDRARTMPSVRDKSKEPSFWLSLQEVEKRMKTEKRHIFVDLYTDWCGPCKLMDKKTFRDEKVIQQLRDNYYAIKFDAESRETVQFAGKEFKYVTSRSAGGYNQFAAALTKGELVFPSLVFLNEDMKVFKVVRGYKSARRLNKILEKNRQH